MTRLSIVLPCLLWCACAVESAVVAPESLMEGQGDAVGVKGLERLESSGAYLAGATERFRVHVDEAKVARVTFSASAGSLTASGRTAEWKLPNLASAELTVTVTGRDGAEGTMRWQFAVTPLVENNRPMTAQAALLAMPMPVLDGGSLEISGGGCEVRYEGSTNNIAIAFTTQTHPSLMYGRWNGTAWSLEVVDAMGFNTGGVIDPFVSMQVEANGTPHIVYVREGTVMYATKSGATWLRERVDATSPALTSNFSSSTEALTAPSLALSGSTVGVVYQTGSSGSVSPYRVVIALRTGANTWTRNVVTASVPTSSSDVYLYGELAVDGSGRWLVPTYDYSASPSPNQLVAWTSAAGRSAAVLPPLTARGESVIVGGNRLLIRTAAGLFDVALASTFSASTVATSSVELNGTGVGAIAWSAAQSRPVLLHAHGSALELVTSNAAGFWAYTQLGSTAGVSAGVAVHPTTGEATVCYQNAGRIMFQ
ncbi:MAG: hypothetical protein GQE15_07325 [Archangiaceae bacterium]|nr:hypothetical protein [Archangiaceae bacterium]